MQKNYIFAMINLIIYFFLKKGIFSFGINFILIICFFVFTMIQAIFIIKNLKNANINNVDNCIDFFGIIFWVIQIIFFFYYLLKM